MPQETLGLVGESGCGKTPAGRTVLSLYPATEGQVFFNEIELTALGSNELRRIRQKMQMIFQDPQDSLNPRMTVGSIVSEPLVEHTKSGRGTDRTRRGTLAGGRIKPLSTQIVTPTSSLVDNASVSELPGPWP
ncbi:MAG: hypothetical protein Ct9H300mP16_13250 [Pseudomonadota bacterium]|nr:MAG: hypothetical protein Ct9H300mP16_13250 [Pseudomonadota bacterium]